MPKRSFDIAGLKWPAVFVTAAAAAGVVYYNREHQLDGVYEFASPVRESTLAGEAMALVAKVPSDPSDLSARFYVVASDGELDGAELGSCAKLIVRGPEKRGVLSSQMSAYQLSSFESVPCPSGADN